MEFVEVNSSNIEAVGYDEATGDLGVKFRNGSEYRYHDVSRDTHEGLMQAHSIGSFLHQHVKQKHNATKIK